MHTYILDRLTLKDVGGSWTVCRIVMFCSYILVYVYVYLPHGSEDNMTSKGLFVGVFLLPPFQNFDLSHYGQVALS
jgi:hypothetical protein